MIVRSCMGKGRNRARGNHHSTRTGIYRVDTTIKRRTLLYCCAVDTGSLHQNTPHTGGHVVVGRGETRSRQVTHARFASKDSTTAILSLDLTEGFPPTKRARGSREHASDGDGAGPVAIVYALARGLRRRKCCLLGLLCCAPFSSTASRVQHSRYVN